MIVFLIYFISVVLGFFLGVSSGVLIPFGAAKILQLLTNDKSDSGLGFLAILLVPIMAVYGAKFGFDVAKRFVNSGVDFKYFTEGQGLYVGMSFYILGLVSLVFAYHMGLTKIITVPFDTLKNKIFSNQQLPSSSPHVSAEFSEEEKLLWQEISLYYVRNGMPAEEVDKTIRSMKDALSKQLTKEQRVAALKSTLNSIQK